jgi:phosphatidate cytidylyltransferase
MTRIITALIGIPALIYIIKFAPIQIFVAVVFAAMLLCLYEYFSLSSVQQIPALAITGYALASLIFFSFYFQTIHLAMWFPLGALIVLIAGLISRIDFAGALPATAYTLFGPWYTGGLLGYLVAIRNIDKIGANLVLSLFVIMWAGDTGAFVVGKWLGRRPLTKISPRKTMEGSLGGLVFSMLLAVGCKYFLLPELSVNHAIWLGALIGIMGQIGDLAESLLKRSAKVKDSGSILPGHGGMLDRLDSLLFGAPAMYYYVYFVLNR